MGRSGFLDELLVIRKSCPELDVRMEERSEWSNDRHVIRGSWWQPLLYSPLVLYVLSPDANYRQPLCRDVGLYLGRWATVTSLAQLAVDRTPTSIFSLGRKHLRASRTASYTSEARVERRGAGNERAEGEGGGGPDFSRDAFIIRRRWCLAHCGFLYKRPPVLPLTLKSWQERRGGDRGGGQGWIGAAGRSFLIRGCQLAWQTRWLRVPDFLPERMLPLWRKTLSQRPVVVFERVHKRVHACRHGPAGNGRWILGMLGMKGGGECGMVGNCMIWTWLWRNEGC